MAIRRQIINPYIRHARGATGPYANRIRNAVWGRGINQAQALCFQIMSAEIGTIDPEKGTICFNAEHDQTTCTVDGDWTLYKNPGVTYNSLPNTAAGVTGSYTSTCLLWQAISLTAETDSPTAPTDDPSLDYTPGTCRKNNTTEDECLLPQYQGYPITNNIYGPSTARIGDLGDNIVLVVFPVALQTIGTAWAVKVNGSPVNITNSQIVNGNLRLTLASSVSSTDTVLYSHGANQTWSDAAVSSDGRICWRFYDKPVLNVLGSNFWVKEDGGAWLLDGQPGRWESE